VVQDVTQLVTTPDVISGFHWQATFYVGYWAVHGSENGCGTWSDCGCDCHIRITEQGQCSEAIRPSVI